jgi:hypothetical protein
MTWYGSMDELSYFLPVKDTVCFSIYNYYKLKQFPVYEGSHVCHFQPSLAAYNCMVAPFTHFLVHVLLYKYQWFYVLHYILFVMPSCCLKL